MRSEPINTSQMISATNFAPRERSAMAEVKGVAKKQGLNVEAFEDFLASNDLSRKDFCDAIGVGESTLSGWLRGAGVPLSVTALIALADELDLCKEQVRQMGEALDAAEYDDRIVREGETFMVIRFNKSGNEGQTLSAEQRQPIGEIIARDIPDLDTALSLTRRQPLVRMLLRLTGELESAPEGIGAPKGFRDDLMHEALHALHTATMQTKPGGTDE